MSVKPVRMDTTGPLEKAFWPRRSERVSLAAEVLLRRPGQNKYRVNVQNISRHGCRVEFVERPQLDELVWLKFDDMEALQSTVCWADGFVAGLEFEREIHPAVFNMLLARLQGGR